MASLNYLDIVFLPFRKGAQLVFRTVHFTLTFGSFLCVGSSLYLLLVPAWAILPGRVYQIFEEKAVCSVQYMIGGWLMAKKYSVVESGDSIESMVDEETVVVPNHQSSSDIAYLMWVFGSRGKSGQIMWIMDYILKYSQFGMVGLWRQDCFIRQGSDVRQSTIKSLSQHIFDTFWPRFRKWILIFPEGGFLWKRKESSQRYASLHGYPALDHVTLPRPTGMYAILDTASPQGMNKHEIEATSERRPIKWILDVTIVYQGMHAVDELDLMFGRLPPNTTHIHYRKYPIQDVPLNSEDEFRSWLYSTWAEKENIIKDLLRVPEDIGEGRLEEANLQAGNASQVSNERTEEELLVSKYRFRRMRSPVTLMLSLYVAWSLIIYAQYKTFRYLAYQLSQVMSNVDLLKTR